MNCFTVRQYSADSQVNSGKVVGLLMGQLYVGPNSLWAPFVTVIVQLMYCLVLCFALLCSGFAGMHPPNIWGVCPTKVYMLKSPLITALANHG